MTLGWTNGSILFGTTMGAPGSNTAIQNTATSNYGANVGDSVSQAKLATNKAIGITTDTAKSGIVGTVTRTQINCKYIIKY